MKKRILSMPAAMCAAILLLMVFAKVDFFAADAFAETKKIADGSTWVVDKTTPLTELFVGKGASIKPPEGCTLTMTIDGTETSVDAGSYKGNIVLTVAEAIVVNKESFGTKSKYSFRAAIDVEDGAVVEKRSVMAAVSGGKVTNASAKDVTIKSAGDNFNGIYVRTGETNKKPFSYSIENLKVSFKGNGGDDFAGYGAAVAVSGYADVTVKNARIITDGVIRSAIFAGDNATLHVNDSYIETGSPELPKNVTGMMSVPWVLGLTGTCRSTMATGSATAYYKNTHIRAKAWGALSTDSVQNVKLTATNCIIETIDSGYGAYADGSSVDTFSGCTFNVKDYALIMTQGSGVFTDRTVVNSQRFGVMSHSGRGNEKLVIDKGSVFNTGEAAIQLKSSAPEIFVDNATFNSKNGIILQAMENDDPLAGGSGGGMPGVGSGGGAMGGVALGGAPGGNATSGGMPQGGMPQAGGMPQQGGMPGGAGGGGSSDIHATFKNTTLNGDIITSMTKLGDVIVSFENVTITGSITTATWKSQAKIEGVDVASFGAFSRDAYKYAYLIGEGTKTYCATDDKYGIKVSLDGKSKWIVDKTSFLTELTIARGAAVAALQGSKVIMTVDGVEKPIGTGIYKGKIVMKIVKN